MSDRVAETFSVDLNDLTIAEIEQIEEIIDAPFDAAFAPGMKRGKVLRALAFVAKRREDPTFTVEQAGRLRIEVDATTDPTEASAP